ncbi:hypothetical protein AX15_003637 [Amanita polypyramis BW_CC]|nr:hypothetical protein AX15_003637 [Amanita polypyramis BW_CC]
MAAPWSQGGEGGEDMAVVAAEIEAEVVESTHFVEIEQASIEVEVASALVYVDTGLADFVDLDTEEVGRADTASTGWVAPEPVQERRLEEYM